MLPSTPYEAVLTLYVPVLNVVIVLECSDHQAFISSKLNKLFALPNCLIDTRS